jgi:gluconate 2-dehydrogenase gamma chain
VGASEANVGVYVDWVMSQRFFNDREAEFVDGLEFLNSIALQQCHRSFAECSVEEQDVAMRRMAQIPRLSCYRFLRSVVNMCLAGFLCDPKYGGNSRGIGWKYMAFRWKQRSSEAQWDEER